MTSKSPDANVLHCVFVRSAVRVVTSVNWNVDAGGTGDIVVKVVVDGILPPVSLHALAAISYVFDSRHVVTMVVVFVAAAMEGVVLVQLLAAVPVAMLLVEYTV